MYCKSLSLEKQQMRCAFSSAIINIKAHVFKTVWAQISVFIFMFFFLSPLTFRSGLLRPLAEIRSRSSSGERGRLIITERRERHQSRRG